MTLTLFRATLPDMSPAERLALSEGVIDGWERHGKPGGPVEQTMRIIGEELAKLREIAKVEPALAARAEAIGGRYGRMALRVKLSAN